MKIVAGWEDAPIHVYDTIEEVQSAFREVFSDSTMTLDEMRRRVEEMNADGGQNEFIFRPAWPDEVVAEWHTQIAPTPQR
jgi:hypothetical protein